MRQYHLGVVLEVINRFSGPMLEAHRQIRAMEDQTKGLVEVSRRVQNVGKGMALAGAAIVGAFALPTNAAMKFEGELATLKSISGATAEEFVKLQREAKQLGVDTRFDPTEAVQAMQELASAGQNTQQILGSIRPTLLLAEAGNLRLGEAAAAVSGVLNSFRLDVSKTAHVVDVMAASGNISAFKIGELGPAIGAAGAAAYSANQSLEETIAVMASLRNAGVSAMESGTAVRSALNALMSPSDEARKLIAMLGIQTRDASGKMLPMTQVFENISGALSRFPAAQADVFKAKIMGGSEGLRVFNSVMNTGIGEVRRMRETMIEANGVGEQFAKNNRNTLSGSLTFLKGSVSTLGIEIGEQLVPAVTRALDIFTSGVNRILGFARDHATLTKIIVFSTLAFGGLLLVAGSILFTLGTLGVMIPAVASGWAALNAALLVAKTGLVSVLAPLWGLAAAAWAAMAPLIPFIAAAGALAWAGHVIWKNWAQIRGEFRLLFDWMAEAGPKILDTFIDGFLGAAGRLKDAAGKVFGALREYLPFSDAKVGPLSDLTLSGMRFAETFGGGIEDGEGALSMKVEKTLKVAMPDAAGARRGAAGRGEGSGQPSRGGIVLNSPVFNLSGGSTKSQAMEFLSVLDRVSRGLA
ncbi:MAG: phage tail tape measure protein [Deltaproteobacteria bacterium]|nr:phage tail tape measure protein [Deltaproteobacteria bacterium]